MLRASIDDMPAIGLVFENPNSADLLLGAITPGSHDLILYDGVQEVVITPDVVDGRARPLYTYSDKQPREQTAS